MEMGPTEAMIMRQIDAEEDALVLRAEAVQAMALETGMDPDTIEDLCRELGIEPGDILCLPGAGWVEYFIR